MNRPTVDPEAIAHAHALLKADRRCTCFSGAGLSAPSGVSTFRDPTGHWKEHDPMRLASPEGFIEDPELVLQWYADRRRQMAEASPNAAHHALAARGDIINVTQNTDDLLARAGARGVIQIHGDITTDRCHAMCGHVESIDMQNPPGPRPCPACHRGGLRPNVVWFGEGLVMETWARAEEACTTARTLLVVGTSAVVYPAASLIDLARSAGAAIIVVNPEPSGASALADIELAGSADEVLPSILGTRSSLPHRA